MKRAALHTLFCALLPALFCAQKNLTKTVVDSRSLGAIDHVVIQSDNGSIKLMSNKNGQFILINDPNVRSFIFYKMGYRKKTLSAAELLSMDTVRLMQLQVELDEVVVRNNKIDTIVKDKRYYVDDYCILPDHNFLIITSRPNAAGFELCYYDKVKGIVQKKIFKNESGEHLVTDCFKNIHLVTNDYSRQIFFDSENSFDLLAKYPRRIFDSTIAACVLKTDTQVVMKQEAAAQRLQMTYYAAMVHAPFVNYIRISKHGSGPFFSGQYNERMREMRDHEVEDSKMFAKNEYVAESQIVMFYQSIARQLYYPMFLKNDTVVVFDFQENKILFLAADGSELKHVALDPHDFMTMRDFEIIHDEAAQKFYLKIKTTDRCYLKLIDVYSGKIVKTIKLEKIFAQNVQIAGDRIYYLVKEKQWDDTQYLYQQN